MEHRALEWSEKCEARGRCGRGVGGVPLPQRGSEGPPPGKFWHPEHAFQAIQV